MESVIIRIFDNDTEAAVFAGQSADSGRKVAVSSIAAPSVVLRYKKQGQAMSLTVDGDGSVFAVMVFD